MKLKPYLFTLGCTAVLAVSVLGQEGNSKAATGGARPPQINPGFLCRDVPVMDPGSDTSTFDGKLWNMNNNRLFRSRFEKYLNAPAETSEADLEYEKTINEILSLLSPGFDAFQSTDAVIAIPKKGAIKSRSNQHMAKPALSEVLNNHGLEVDFGLNDGGFFLQLVVCHSASNV